MATGSGGGNRKGKTWLFAVLFFLAPLITAIVPRLTPAMLALVAITIIVAAFRQRAENGVRWKELLTPSAAFLACLAFSLYVFLNASWAWNPSAGFAKAALLLGVILVVFATASAVRAIDEQQVRSATIAFAAGAFLGAAYLALELLIDGAVMRLAMNTIPALQPDDIKRVTIVDGVVTRVSLNKLNQNITTIMLNAWPAMLMLSAAALRYRWGMVALFFAISAVAVFLSDHDSSQLALLGSVVVFALARRWQRWDGSRVGGGLVPCFRACRSRCSSRLRRGAASAELAAAFLPSANHPLGIHRTESVGASCAWRGGQHYA